MKKNEFLKNINKLRTLFKLNNNQIYIYNDSINKLCLKIFKNKTITLFILINYKKCKSQLYSSKDNQKFESFYRSNKNFYNNFLYFYVSYTINHKEILKIISNQ